MAAELEHVEPRALSESVKYAARSVTMTSLTKVGAAVRVALQQLAVARVVDRRRAGAAAGHEQPVAVIDLHAERGAPHGSHEHVAAPASSGRP